MPTDQKYDLSSNEKIFAAIQDAAGFEPYSVAACTLQPFEFPSVLLVHHLSDGPRGYFADGVYVADRLNAGPALATRGWAAADAATREVIALEWTDVALAEDLIKDRAKYAKPRFTRGEDGSISLRAHDGKTSRILNFIFGADGRIRFPVYDVSTDEKLRQAVWEVADIEEKDLSRCTRRVEEFPGVILVGGLIHDWGYQEVGYFANGTWVPSLWDSGPAMELRGYAKADRKTKERLALAWANIIQSRLQTVVVKSEPDGSVTVRGSYALPRGMQQHAEPEIRDFSVRFGPDGRRQ